MKGNGAINTTSRTRNYRTFMEIMTATLIWRAGLGTATATNTHFPATTRDSTARSRELVFISLAKNGIITPALFGGVVAVASAKGADAFTGTVRYVSWVAIGPLTTAQQMAGSFVFGFSRLCWPGLAGGSRFFSVMGQGRWR